MGITINNFEIENTKRVKAVYCELTEYGLNIIGGKSEQGKTSILDAICWLVGGNKYKPSNPKNDEATSDPYMKVTLSNGLIVERKGRNSDLKVTDPKGMQGSQTLLNSFIGELAIDLPKFMNSTNKEKAKSLLNHLGIGDKLTELNVAEKETFEERTFQNRVLKDKQAILRDLKKDLYLYKDAPAELITMDSLLEKQQVILDANKSNDTKRIELGKARADYKNQTIKIDSIVSNRLSIETQIRDLEVKKQVFKEHIEKEVYEQDRLLKLGNDLKPIVEALEDTPLDEIKEEMKAVDVTNDKVKKNQEYAKAKEDVEDAQVDYNEYDAGLEEIRSSKRKLLEGAKLPLEGLSIEDGELVYQGQKWDCMSATGQVRVSAAIVHALYPNCGFVLMDKLEGLDEDQLVIFDKWLKKEGLQVIGTRVSTGSECTIIIEDGMVKDTTIK